MIVATTAGRPARGARSHGSSVMLVASLVTVGACRARHRAATMEPAHTAPVAAVDASTLLPQTDASATRPLASPPPGPSPIDEHFRALHASIPEPDNLGEGNGMSINCPGHGYVTFSWLAHLGRDVPIASDAELPRLVPWARGADMCLRHIAVEAIVHRIGFDTDRLEGNSMHDPESALFHDIMVELDRYLAAHSVAGDPHAFDGLYTRVRAEDFASLHGRWAQDVGPRVNFQQRLYLAPNEIRLTRHLRRPEPGWPDRPELTRFTAVTVNERQQFVVQGEWIAEVDVDGAVGAHSPASEPMIFWRISNDVLAMRTGGEAYETFRRVTDPTGWEIPRDASVGAAAHGP